MAGSLPFGLERVMRSRGSFPLAEATTAMKPTTTELKNEIEKSLGLMRTLRDEVRVKLHLAGMDAKDEWWKLEPKLEELERAASEATEATRTAIAEAVHKLSKLRSTLSKIMRAGEASIADHPARRERVCRTARGLKRLPSMASAGRPSSGILAVVQ